MPFRFKEVSAETKDLIDIGDQVIRDCRALVTFRAGNQKDDVLRSGGTSYYLTERVRERIQWVTDTPLRTASVTCAYGAGVCHHMAMVAYTILRSKLPATQNIAYLNFFPPHDHGFVTIGIPGEVPTNKVVCVDPWPINTQALLLGRSFLLARSRVPLAAHNWGEESRLYGSP